MKRRRLTLFLATTAFLGVGCSLIVSYDGYGDGVRQDGGDANDGDTTSDGATDGTAGDGASDAGGDALDGGSDANKRYALVVLGGRTYVDGGPGQTNASVEYAVINPDGTLGAWTAGPPMPSPEDEVGAASWGSSVFISDDFGAAAAVMLPDGGMSGWTTLSAVNRNNPRMVAVDGQLYLATGTVGSVSAPEVYRATITGPQTLGAWIPTTSLPADGGPRNNGALVASGKTLYIAGGENAGGVMGNVLMAQIDGTGAVGAWTDTTPLPSIGDHLRVIASGGRITILGASYPSISDRSVHTAPVQDGGALGAWQTGALHPDLDSPTPAVHGGFVYLISGSIASNTDTAAVVYAPLDPSGFPATWLTTSSVKQPRHAATAVVVEVPP